MAIRKYKLTWQKGTQGRVGRWRKILFGKAFYFDGGFGKTDQDAYRLAVDECDQLKAKLAASSKKPHAADYAKSMAQWDAVIAWSKQNENDEYLDRAENKLRDLNKRLSGPRPRALERDDWFLTQFTFPKEILEQIAANISGASADQDDGQSNPLVYRPSQNDMDAFGILPREHHKRIWDDRIQSITGKSVPESRSISANIRRFLDHHLVRVQLKKISPGRYENIRRSVEYFGTVAGNHKPIEDVNELLLRDFYSKVQKQVAGKKLSTSTGRDHVAVVDQFIRWIWREGVIVDLPRNLSNHEIVVAPSKIETFELGEIKKLWSKANSKMQLYILLALNCGMTQKDISDLHPSEVNWRQGEITRKRSKTSSFESTPTVTYRLWPETLRLLKTHRSKNKQHVLLNKLKHPLKTEEILEDGRHRKTDSIGREFGRLRTVCEISGRSFIDLKKTARSLLEANKNYQPVAELFVGRAPSSISEKHYAKAPMGWLADATDWLRKKLEVNKFGTDKPNKK